MKKQHPLIKAYRKYVSYLEGLKVPETQNELLERNNEIQVTKKELKRMIKKYKWIEEVQKLEFTKKDMIKFAHSRAGYNTYTTDLDKWIKENKKY